jgi:hypothetical protein
MTLATPTIRVYFGSDAVPGDEFVLDDPVKGVLDSVTYLLGGDTGTLIDGDAYDIQIRRGRSRELDEFEAGTCTVVLHNHDRTYDDTNAASALFGNVIPGKRVSVSIWNQVVFEGTVEDWDNDWSVDEDASATMFAVDGLGQLALREFDEWTTTASQTAGTRIDAALNRPEVDYSISRDLDTGVSSLQADNVTWGSNVLNYLQLVAKSDAGRLFVTRDGTLRYQDRQALINPVSEADFADDSTGVHFHGITTTVGADLFFNRVGVDREGGTLQTSEDVTSQHDAGIRALSMSGLLMDTDDQASDMADWMLGLYKTPSTRVSSIMVKINALSASDRGYITQLDIGDVVTVSWTPQHIGASLDQVLVVEGIEHQLNSTGLHVMWLHTSLASQVGVFILDDSTYGRLDTGGVLAF